MGRLDRGEHCLIQLLRRHVGPAGKLDVARLRLVAAIGMKSADSSLDVLADNGGNDCLSGRVFAHAESDLVHPLVNDSGEVRRDLDANGYAQRRTGPTHALLLPDIGIRLPEREEITSDRRTAGGCRFSELVPAAHPDSRNPRRAQVVLEKGHGPLFPRNPIRRQPPPQSRIRRRPLRRAWTARMKLDRSGADETAGDGQNGVMGER